ncbi:unnamed protein product [Clavelina lepadiformis]|uniref:Fibronectin type-III domain-containing protein n=1 Tax=Clavelina lepadiformis TaxID=159417 RepID=A0ABP0G7R0_CLALP
MNCNANLLGFIFSRIIVSLITFILSAFVKHTGVEINDQTSTSFVVNWNQPFVSMPATTSGYIITWSSLYTTGSTVVSCHGTASAIKTGLMSNTEYSVQVAARSYAEGIGALSEKATQLTAETRVCSPTLLNKVFQKPAIDSRPNSSLQYNH